MNIVNIILGVLLIVIGLTTILLYEKHIKKNRKGGLSFKLRTGGIGSILIGLYLIINELI